MKNKKSGFTLIELMVAIAIIGILAAVVMTSLSSYGDRARATNALRIAENIMPAAMECSIRNQNITVNFPGSTGDGSNGSPNAGGEICSGSMVTWPALDKSSTRGWNWWYIGGVPSGPNRYFYALRNPTTGGFINCVITDLWWQNNFDSELQPGVCKIEENY